jgi:hypothetical protein
MAVRSAVPGPWWADPAPDGTLTCAVCGEALVGDPLEVTDAPPGPLCDACARAREFDQTLWELDLAEPDDGLW